MIRKIAAIAFVAVCLCTLRSGAEPGERSSGAADRQSLNVTIYNGGLALVHDRRRIHLTHGINRIAWRDVSAGMDSSTVLLQAMNADDPVSVLEQNFDYDLLDPSALLEKYVGRDVVVVHEARFPGERDTRETARVLSANGGNVVLQYRDRIETGVRGYIVFPNASKHFRDKPTLVLTLESDAPGIHALDLSYLTNGLTWSADYVGVMSADESRLNLTGLVTLSNTSGASYEGARLQLVAGNLNIAQPAGTASQLRTIAAVRSADTYQVGMSQENLFEYHLYTLRRPTTILDKQTKQVALLSAHDIPVRETLELRGSPYYYRYRSGDLGDRLPVGVYVTFENRGGDLGVPLPAGTVRVYETDSRGVSQFAGSDNIGHTPKNDTVRLHLGDAFDVVARKKQTDFHVDSGCSAESAYEIVLLNVKTQPQNVQVVETLPGDWSIVTENYQHVKSSSSTATWTVPVPAGGNAALTYRARVRWCS